MDLRVELDKLRTHQMLMSIQNQSGTQQYSNLEDKIIAVENELKLKVRQKQQIIEHMQTSNVRNAQIFRLETSTELKSLGNVSFSEIDYDQEL